jgi:hypothetical protein
MSVVDTDAAMNSLSKAVGPCLKKAGEDRYEDFAGMTNR